MARALEQAQEALATAQGATKDAGEAKVVAQQALDAVDLAAQDVTAANDAAKDAKEAAQEALDKAEAALEQRSGLGDVSAGVAGGVSEAAVRRIVAAAVDVRAADGVERPDYALASAGATVVYEPQYVTMRTPCWCLLGCRSCGWCGAHGICVVCLCLCVCVCVCVCVCWQLAVQDLRAHPHARGEGAVLRGPRPTPRPVAAGRYRRTQCAVGVQLVPPRGVSCHPLTGCSPLACTCLAPTQPDTHVGKCWPMAGSDGFVTVRLSHSGGVKPTHFTVDHAHKDIAHGRASAPRFMEAWVRLTVSL